MRVALRRMGWKRSRTGKRPVKTPSGAIVGVGEDNFWRGRECPLVNKKTKAAAALEGCSQRALIGWPQNRSIL